MMSLFSNEYAGFNDVIYVYGRFMGVPLLQFVNKHVFIVILLNVGLY